MDTMETMETMETPDQNNNTRYRITAEPQKGDYRDVVVLLDASASMGKDLCIVKTMAEAALAAGATVVLFSTTASVVRPSCANVDWDTLERSSSWKGRKSYEEALKAAEEFIHSDSIVLFVTDGAPSVGHHLDILDRILDKIHARGFMQSLFLGTTRNMDVLATLYGLCTEDKLPMLTSSVEFEATVRGFLSHSINSTETEMGVRVGAVRV
jgi:Mg-chelatase subunit ChlD